MGEMKVHLIRRGGLAACRPFKPVRSTSLAHQVTCKACSKTLNQAVAELASRQRGRRH